MRGLCYTVVTLSFLAGAVGTTGTTFAREAEAQPQPEPQAHTWPNTVGVMEFVAVCGFSQDQADVLADVLAAEIGGLGEIRVITKSDIQSVLDLEKQRRLAGCTDYECVAEIGGALGMRWMVTGSVGRFGETLLLNLKLTDVKEAQVTGRVVRKIRGEIDDLLGELPEVVEELFEKSAEDLGLTVEKRVTAAARHVQPISQSPSAITVITREDIEASGANTIPDLLRLVPGMDVIVVSPFFTALTARLYHTYENNHFLVLIDGREANVELMGQVHWEVQSIIPEDVERIEVIRGPGSSLYGANALAGVISITTRSVPEATSGWARVIGGEPGMVSAATRGSTVLGNWGFSLSAGADYSGAFDDPRSTSKEVWKIRSMAEYSWSESRRVTFEAGATHSNGAFTTPLGFIDGTYNIRTLRLAYRSENLRGNLYWMWSPVDANLTGPLDYHGVRLAEFIPTDIEMHMVDGEFQWTLPSFWEPLLAIVGAGGRFCWVSSDQLLDAETFTDMSSDKYHRVGVRHLEGRASAFAHAEIAAASWVTLTGGLRFDYNTETDVFLSPRLAAVFRLAEGQFIRLGAARAFRKPAYFETGAHPMARFPPGSPITGESQETFLEFLTRVAGNSRLNNEELLSFEAGYLGQYLDGALSVALDLYYNLHTELILLDSNIIHDPATGLPDLDKSSYMFGQNNPDLSIIGSELSVRYSPSRHVSLLACWNHWEVFESGKSVSTTPKNQMTLGGRFSTPFGLLGSLYAFSRSEHMDRTIDNPAGLMEPMLVMKMENVVLLLGKLGWGWEAQNGVEMEVGVKLFLPVSPFKSPYFRFYERGGGITTAGVRYGSQQLSRTVTGYFQGSF